MSEAQTFRPIIMSRKEQLLQEEALNGRLSPAETIRRNINNVVQPLLTDLYQVTMAYAYWESGKKDAHATFDLFFRRNPFKGEYTIFAGLDDCLKFIKYFSYTDDDVNYLKKILPEADPEFFEYLRNLNSKDVTVRAIPEGTVVFPKVPLLRVDGPLPVVQLMETTLLNLINYASLVCTNATRYRKAAGKEMQLLEFGLRRSQGPDGGLSASKYIYMGGFDASSNVLAGKMYGIPVKGTHAHAFVMSFSSTDELRKTDLKVNGKDETKHFVSCCQKWQKEVSTLFDVNQGQVSEGEFTSFVAYAMSFPNTFLALIDTYDVMKKELTKPEDVLFRLRSGVVNFCSVALALNEFGYRPIGVRLDSGDLAYLSNLVHDNFASVANKFNLPWFTSLTIVASNDINEEIIGTLKEQGHKITCFGIGTHLVTCQKQPALGCVYKLVEINSKSCIKLSQDASKVTIPGKKLVYRLYGVNSTALLDLMQLEDEPAPVVGQRITCRHPFEELKRVAVTPARVELLSQVRWENNQLIDSSEFNLEEVKNKVRSSLHSIRDDIRRHINPTPYKVSVSDKLYAQIHQLMSDKTPMPELS